MLKRFAEKKVQEALSDTRVVLIAGPRQSGKTTLANAIAGDSIPYFTLDDSTVLSAAKDDPNGFIRGLNRAVIDEIQRAPELLTAIKMAVDADARPGRFLLTGSANIMTIPVAADSLAGRMEIINLLPLSQAEIRAEESTFLDNAFDGQTPRVGRCVVGSDLIELVLAGGYPEALSRKRWSRKQDWYNAYVNAIIQRDIQDIARIDQLGIMPRLLEVLAEHSGQLVSHSSIGSAIDLNHVTTQKYVRALQSLFLIQTIQPWFSKKLKRLTKSPKLHFLDAGLLASVRNITPETVAKDKTPFGAILETFVFSELQKLASWSDHACTFSHFRDKDNNEVDIVIENRRGEIIGVEVKASASVSAGDFSGMRKLADACDAKFKQGMVLYDHDKIVPFSENMSAVPISSLWA